MRVGLAWLRVMIGLGLGMGCAIIYESKDNLYFIIYVKNVDKEKKFYPSVIPNFSFCAVLLFFPEPTESI